MGIFFCLHWRCTSCWISHLVFHNDKESNLFAASELSVETKKGSNTKERKSSSNNIHPWLSGCIGVSSGLVWTSKVHMCHAWTSAQIELEQTSTGWTSWQLGYPGPPSTNRLTTLGHVTDGSSIADWSMTASDCLPRSPATQIRLQLEICTTSGAIENLCPIYYGFMSKISGIRQEHASVSKNLTRVHLLGRLHSDSQIICTYTQRFPREVNHVSV